MCHPEFLKLLPADDRVRCSPGHQPIRFQCATLLLALVYGMSVEMTALPEIVAEHFAVPYPVDLAELLGTLTAAEWGGSRFEVCKDRAPAVRKLYRTRRFPSAKSSWPQGDGETAPQHRQVTRQPHERPSDPLGPAFPARPVPERQSRQHR
ncbi:hypothetical protein ADL12_03350 [Streptomyces regalis]|uniref:iHD-CE domain-containing protein n=1 Tax=Streptomyces regalis TaxID=68262 RepID=A0A0X3VLJ6_9ACTN|nr:hypothetical protein ADL12_03350 [Streptomyces regalis]